MEGTVSFTEIGSSSIGSIFPSAYGFSDVNIHGGVSQREVEGSSSVILTT